MIFNYPVTSAVKNMTLNVNVTGLRAWKWRVWIGLRLIRIAALIIGCGFHVERD